MYKCIMIMKEFCGFLPPKGFSMKQETRWPASLLVPGRYLTLYAKNIAN